MNHERLCKGDTSRVKQQPEVLTENSSPGGDETFLRYFPPLRHFNPYVGEELKVVFFFFLLQMKSSFSPSLLSSTEEAAAVCLMLKCEQIPDQIPWTTPPQPDPPPPALPSQRETFIRNFVPYSPNKKKMGTQW